MDLTDEDVRAIVQLLDASGFHELQIETDAFTLALRRGDDQAWSRDSTVLATPQTLPPATGAAATDATSIAAAVTAAGPTLHAGLHDVKAPLPGTFYRAPKPGSAPFVEIGGRVEADAVVGIIETMRLMNSVCAGIRGHIVEICVHDAEPAAQGAVLLRIQPDP